MAPTGEMIVGVEESRFEVLRPDSDIRDALLANVAEGEAITPQDLPRVSSPAGGGSMWNWTDAGNNDQSAKSIDGVLAWVGRYGTLWGSESPEMGKPPVLVTNDLVTARKVSDDIGDLDPEVLESCRIGDGVYDWVRLPYNRPGSGAAGGQSRRCKEMRRLAILREGEAWPLLVSVGPGSLKRVCPFLKTGMAVPHYRSVVSLTLEKCESQNGQPFSQIVPIYLGSLSKEEGGIIKRLYTDPLNRMASTFDGNG